jgi:DNA-binding beta-propeller fold protein YncE
MPYGSGKYTYQLVDEWAELPKGWTFTDGAGIAVDANDKIYILSRSAHPVTMWDRAGNLLGTWGEGYFKRAHEATFGPDGSVWCADDGTHIVTKFTTEGKVLQVLGTKDQPSDSGYVQAQGLDSIKRGAGPFNRPTGVQVSPEGIVFVSDGYGNARVHKFGPDGKLIKSWGEPGTGPGQFRLVHNVWLDSKGRVLVCDRENNRVQIFDMNGKFITHWTDVKRPTDLFIDKEGTIYISELPQRISIFTNDGKLLTRLSNKVEGDPWKDTALAMKVEMVAPHTLAVDSKGDIYIGEVAMTMGKVERGTRVVRKFVRV